MTFSKFFLKKNFLQIFFAIISIGLALYFIDKEREELVHVRRTLTHAHIIPLLMGFGVTVLYIISQALMYVHSFRTIGNKVSFMSCLRLYLKRNVISVFLPGGGVTSLAFFTDEIEKEGVTKSQIHFSSLVYGFCGIFTVFLISIPVLGFTLIKHSYGTSIYLAFAGLTFLITGLSYAIYSAYKGGWVYKSIVKFRPGFEQTVADLKAQPFYLSHFIIANSYSFLLEVIGIIHMYISMVAVGATPSMEASMLGYVISVIFLTVSPFMRGLGGIEVSLAYILELYGYKEVASLSITFLFRGFEFWFPLLAGVFTFLFSSRKLAFLYRAIPATLLFLLGLVNIFSFLRPELNERLSLLKNFIPFSIINVSHYSLILTGIALVVVSGYVLRGYKNIWKIAVFISAFSLIIHLTKALDYEEAGFAFITLLALWFVKKYFVKTDNSEQTN